MGSVIYSAISYSSGNKWVIQAHAIIQMHLKNVVLSKNPTRLYSAITPFYKAQKEEKNKWMCKYRYTKHWNSSDALIQGQHFHINSFMFGYTPELECILLHTWTHQIQTIHFCSKLLIFLKLNKDNNICYLSFIYLEFKPRWRLWMEILFFIIKVLHAPWQPQLLRSAAFSFFVLKPQLKIPSVLTRGWRE